MIRPAPLSMTLLVVLAAAGCKADPPPAPVEAKPVEAKPVEAKPVEAKPVEARSAEAKPIDAKPVDAKPAEPTLTEAAARVVFDKWLGSQNAGEFRSYESTYAPRFFGIKRAGTRTYRFDRAGWMKDRERMFQKPMTVTADEVRITPGPGTARVVFTQTWASGRYRDTGPKQLVLSLHDGQPLIAREEMLQSTVLGPAPRSADAEPLRFVRMLDAPYVILGEAVKTDAAPTLLARGRPHVVKAAVPGQPADLGRAVTLYGPNGRRCGGAIAEVVVLGAVVPHFGAVQTWSGEMDDSPPATEAEIAASVWEMSDDGGRVLAGRLDKAAADCAGALFARLEGPEAPVAGVWRPTPVAPARKNAAAARLRTTDEWKALQKDYREAVDGQGPWDESGDARAVYQGFTSPGGAELVVAIFDAGLGCGGFGGALWQAFAVDGDDLKPVGAPASTPFVPGGAIDTGGPLPTLIGVEGYSGDNAFYGPKDGAYAPTSTLPVLDLDCPC